MSNRKHFSRLGWAYVMFFLAANVSQIALVLTCELILNVKIDMGIMLVLSQICMYLVGMPIFFLCVRTIPAWKPKEIKHMESWRFLLWTVFAIGLTYIGNFAGQLIMLLVEGITGALMENPVDALIMDVKPLYVFFSVAVIAPIMEELMFRKFLIDRTVQFGQMTSMIVSGVAFGLFHGNFYQFFYACGLGMVFAYIYCETGNIWYCIGLHMIINVIGGVVPLLLLQGIKVESGWALIGSMSMPIIMLGSIISTITMFCVNRRKIEFFPGWMPVPEGRLWKSIMLAPGVIAFFLASGAMFLMM